MWQKITTSESPAYSPQWEGWFTDVLNSSSVLGFPDTDIEEDPQKRGGRGGEEIEQLGAWGNEPYSSVYLGT